MLWHKANQWTDRQPLATSNSLNPSLILRPSSAGSFREKPPNSEFLQQPGVEHFDSLLCQMVCIVEVGRPFEIHELVKVQKGGAFGVSQRSELLIDTTAIEETANRS